MYVHLVYQIVFNVNNLMNVFNVITTHFWIKIKTVKLVVKINSIRILN